MLHSQLLSVVAAHLHRLSIDSALAQQSLAVVEDIERIDLNGKIRRNYSFATKYFYWHVPEIYPIYDSYVERLLWAYQQQERFATFRREELQEYTQYKVIHQHFSQSYGLTAFSVKQIDKFLWLYGKEWLQAM